MTERIEWYGGLWGRPMKHIATFVKKGSGMTEREKVCRKLMEIYWAEDMTNNPTGITEHALRLADWVIADRKRIVEPLVKLPPYQDTVKSMAYSMEYAIEATLKNAGVE